MQQPLICQRDSSRDSASLFRIKPLHAGQDTGAADDGSDRVAAPMLDALFLEDLGEDVAATDLISSVGDTLDGCEGTVQRLAESSSGNAAILEVLLGEEEGVEIEGEKSPYGDPLVEVAVAASTQVDEVLD